MVDFAFTNHFFAQTNSVPKIVSPKVIIMTVPGRRIATKPMSNTVNPATAITIFLICFKVFIQHFVSAN